ncbi:MAG TPA: undecaprenyl-diphosphatase [Polaromonas sp.]|uniref:phosphatase PAP2 family protein n=1 Tax=Polaromonas sp. UBA4122 TaxID=1947074 RepID=UPI000EE391DC|nr:phosphatase PAP2 family protein [Polaromonas sp. UBA4122]HAL36827.1 undecaprenyl-diphosphatase [Polaromonas sp.]
MNKIEAFNQSLFLRINAGVDTPSWAVDTAIVIADDLIYLIPMLLFVLWLWGDDARRNQAIKACLVTLLALGANQVIGLVWLHPRPFMIGLGHAWVPHSADSSFPSDHMTVFAGIGLTLLFGGAFRLAAAVLTAGFSVAWARVFLGVHFPLDMVGAVAVTGVAYVVVSPLWRMAGDTFTNLTEKLYRVVFARPIASGWVRR